jgi:hypothetical protein
VVLIQQAFTLSGVVRNLAGTSVSNIRVFAVDQASSIDMGYQTTDASEFYSIPLAGGTYKIRVYRDNGLPASNVPMPEWLQINFRTK